jgi:DNA topoisomerase I
MPNSKRYMMLAAQSSFKGKSDCDKYGKAMRLKGCIDKIRSDYKKNINSKNKFNRQLATAM